MIHNHQLVCFAYTVGTVYNQSFSQPFIPPLNSIYLPILTVPTYLYTINIASLIIIIMPLIFMDLPLEIRLQIYTYVLVSPTGFIKIPSRGSNYAQREWELAAYSPQCVYGCSPFIARSLCWVNKKIFEESYEIIWAQNTFQSYGGGDLGKLRDMKPSVFQKLQHISLSFHVLEKQSPTSTGNSSLDFILKLSKAQALKSITLVKSPQMDRNMNVISNWKTDLRMGKMDTFTPLHEWYLWHIVQTWQDISSLGFFDHIPERRIRVYSLENSCPDAALHPTIENRPFDKYREQWKEKLHPSGFWEILTGEPLGADLWLDDTLCYKNGAAVQPLLTQEEPLEKILSGLEISPEGI